MSQSSVKYEWSRQQQFKNLEIGQVKLLKASDDKIFSVLGSCVSVIFHVPKLITLICHAQMPSQSKFEYKSSGNSAQKYFKDAADSSDMMYVNSSIEYMVNVLFKNKICLQSIHTTILGGASVFKSLGNNSSIGNQNIMVAKKMLNKFNITINREFVGGNNGLTLWYFVNNNKLVINKHGDNIRFELLDIKYPSLVSQ